MPKRLKNERLTYTGQVQPQPGEKDENGQLLYPYLPSDELVEVVNLAIHLKRPLLLKGEPGCGKTQLARAVANELRLAYEEWNIKSTSRAKDGLYTYDAVGRLRDAQLLNHIPRAEFEKIQKRFDKPIEYVKYGPLGNAIKNEENRAVLLIDEIDKADIDFPNDLLMELDKFKFRIEEVDKEVSAEHPPIVFITSNDEKDLPDAFLRRCVFHYIKFPEKEKLKKIIKAHFLYEYEEQEVLPEDLLDKIIASFQIIREEMGNLKGKSGKLVSTSELLDWVQAIIYEIKKKNNENESDFIQKLFEQLLYPGVLLKNWEDYEFIKRRYKQRIESEGKS